MLSPKNKISKSQYQSLLKGAKSVFFDGVLVKFNKTEQENSIFSVIVSAKVSKKAVQRNLIKRIVYNKIKDLKVNEKIKAKAIFVYISKDFGTISRSKINQKTEDLINKICLFFQKR